MSFTYIYYIGRNIRFNYKYRILMASDIESFSLTDSVELSTIMLSYNLSERILLITGLLYVLATAAICLSFKLDVVVYRLRELEKLFIREFCDCIKGPRACAD